jgi:CheY-like chemotaxis protein
MAEMPELLDFASNIGSEAKVRILLVDDNPANLLSLRTILEKLGQNLVEAHSGEEALQRVQSTEFAVILLDVLMPTISGFETANLIRGRENARHTPIIFLTASEIDRSQLEEGYALGAVDFLTKPLVPFVLQAKVRGFIGQTASTARSRTASTPCPRDKRVRYAGRSEADHVAPSGRGAGEAGDHHKGGGGSPGGGEFGRGCSDHARQPRCDAIAHATDNRRTRPHCFQYGRAGSPDRNYAIGSAVQPAGRHLKPAPLSKPALRSAPKLRPIEIRTNRILQLL